MKLLLDECIDRRLSDRLAADGHHVRTIVEMGWAGVRNGELLSLAQSEFDSFITSDRNLSFQQNLSKYSIRVVILQAKSNRLADLLPLVPEMLRILPEIASGTSRVVK